MPLITELLNPACAQVFVGSAKDGANVPAIEQWAVSKLPLGPTLYPKVTDQSCVVIQKMVGLVCLC